jgi:hypothetical protein
VLRCADAFPKHGAPLLGGDRVDGGIGEDLDALRGLEDDQGVGEDQALHVAGSRAQQRRGRPPWYLKAERKNTGSVIQIGQLRRAAAEVTAGTRRAPLN